MGNLIVVGQSITVDDIAAELGRTALSDLEEYQYDRLFVIYKDRWKMRLERLRYG